MTSVYLDSLEVSFSSTVNLFYTWMEAIQVPNRTTRSADRIVYRKLENHFVFQLNTLICF